MEFKYHKKRNNKILIPLPLWNIMTSLIEKKLKTLWHYSFITPILNLCDLTLSCRRSLSYRNQSIGLLCKSMDWFLYDMDLRHERVKAWVQTKCGWIYGSFAQIIKRSSHRRCSVTEVVLKIFYKFHRKTPVFFRVSFFSNFIKKRLQHSCFPVKFVNSLRTPILKNIC